MFAGFRGVMECRGFPADLLANQNFFVVRSRGIGRLARRITRSCSVLNISAHP